MKIDEAIAILRLVMKYHDIVCFNLQAKSLDSLNPRSICINGDCIQIATQEYHDEPQT